MGGVSATEKLKAMLAEFPRPANADDLWPNLTMFALGRLGALFEHAQLHAEEDAKLGAAFDAWLAAPGPDTTPELYKAVGEWRLAGRGQPVKESVG